MKADKTFHSFSFSYLSFSLKRPRFGLVNQIGVFSRVLRDMGDFVPYPLGIVQDLKENLFLGMI